MEATKSSMHEKHGAIIAKGGKVFSAGYNSTEPLRTFGGCPDFGCYVHAEVAAMVSYGVGRTLGQSRMSRKKRSKRFQSPTGTDPRRFQAGSLCGPGERATGWHLHNEIVEPLHPMRKSTKTI